MTTPLLGNETEFRKSIRRVLNYFYVLLTHAEARGAAMTKPDTHTDRQTDRQTDRHTWLTIIAV